jgi:hypothetical protein
MPLTLTLLPGLYAVARLDPETPLPAWADAPGDFSSISRTRDELSIVAPELRVGADVPAERGFAAFRVEGPLPFDAVGILASIAVPIAEAGVSILAVGTFDTDYVLVKERHLPRVREALVARGIVVRDGA